ncbi:MAG: hypothetical protein IT279_10410 [Ignavibacteriaceae bacterium]|nr:hypothetical protein [Ignavibacteriaceae bacterium]
MKRLLLLLAAGLLVFSGCEDRSELTAPPAVNTGSANFTRYVAIGNSLTAGYQSGALYESGQKYGWAALLAKQTGASFAMPTYSDPGSGGRLEIRSLSPFTLVPNAGTGTPTNTTYAAPYNNLGVPGALLYDVMNATNAGNCASGLAGSPNPFFDLVLRNSAFNLGSQFKHAKALSPTFLTLWIGNNDVLGYATSGGTAPAAPTPFGTFNALYTQLADSVASLGANVVVANIPSVTDIPFFTTVGGQFVLNGVTKVWAVTSSGDTAYVSLLPTANGAPNFITLKASTTPPTGFSKATPFPNSVVLDSGEVVTAQTAIAQFNGVIQNLATAKNFGFVDMNTAFKSYVYFPGVSNGQVVDGIRFTNIFVTGGLFSLDGVHPSNQGAAIIANEFIKVINSKFGAAIPRINVATVPGGLNFGKKIEFNSFGLPVIPAGALDNLYF